jgi:hypothetical protein
MKDPFASTAVIKQAIHSPIHSPIHDRNKNIYNSLPHLAALLSGAITRVLTLVGVFFLL